MDTGAPAQPRLPIDDTPQQDPADARGAAADGPRRGGAADTPRRGGAADGPRRGGAVADAPVPYTLTVRARRLVDPASLPELEVVPAEDVRPARARALRRAGVAVADIAAELGVPVAQVQSWCAGLRPVRRRRVTRSDHGPEPDPEAAAAGHLEVAALLQQPAQAAALVWGLVLGCTTVDGTTLEATPADATAAAAVVGWLRTAGVDPERIRVTVWCPPGTATDLVRARWAERLGLDRRRVACASGGTAARVQIRVTDPELAGRIAGAKAALAGAEDLPPGA